MHLKSIVFISFALLQLSVAFNWRKCNGNPCVIKNRRDKTFLTALNEGPSCHKRATVITTDDDSRSKGREWKLQVAGDDEEERFYIVGKFRNEVTVSDKCNCDSNCPRLFAEYEFIRRGHYVQIKSVEKENCLTGHGDGEQISWEDCRRDSGFYRRQLWYLSEDCGDRQ